jgi:hypothetical protein
MPLRSAIRSSSPSPGREAMLPRSGFVQEAIRDIPRLRRPPRRPRTPCATYSQEWLLGGYYRFDAGGRAGYIF